MKEQWHKRVITSEVKGFLKGGGKRAILVIIFLLIAGILYYFRYKSYMYIEFDAIELPLPSRILLSAISFCTSGAILYKIKFYQCLYKICKPFGNRVYTAIKSVIWISLMLINFILIQAIVNVINKSIEVTYNVVLFLLFIN